MCTTREEAHGWLLQAHAVEQLNFYHRALRAFEFPDGERLAGHRVCLALRPRHDILVRLPTANIRPKEVATWHGLQISVHQAEPVEVKKDADVPNVRLLVSAAQTTPHISALR